ncbi:MAG: DUF2079 domain-containing protein [Synechococcales bacterium]|nr:DUF2079 domain-containing protein [Synechococcales bacterium]
MAVTLGKHLRGRSRHFNRTVIITAALFWSVLTVLLLHRHFSMYPSYASFDQGIFNQVFWNGIHGRFFQSSLSSTLSTPVVHDGEVPEVFYHRLGQHFTPALLLWLPVYALFPHPATLLVLQITLVTAAGIVLYFLARQYLQPELSTLITVSFYAANAVIGPSLANFHDLCQIPLFVFSLWLALEKQRWKVFWLLACLILLVREDAGVILFGIGFYLVLSRRYPRLGLAVCTVSLGYMLLLTNLIMPLFSEDISRRFMVEQFAPYIEGDEATTLEVLWALITSPGQILVDLVTPVGRSLRYLLAQWLPLAFVPAISPAAWLLNAFPLVKLFIRDDSTALAINLRYALTLVPGLFYGAILWWSAHPNALKPWFRRLWIACIGLAVLFTLTSNPNRALSFAIPDSFEPRVHIPAPQQWQHVGVVRSFMKQIPADASVSTTTHIVPHLSSRRAIVRFPELKVRTDDRKEIRVDYVLVDVWQLQQYQVAFADDRDRLQQFIPRLDRLIERRQYGLVGFAEGVVFLQRDAATNPEALVAWTAYRRELAPLLN